MNASEVVLLTLSLAGTALLVACSQHAAVQPIEHDASPLFGSTHGARPGDTVTIVANEPIPNLPGKRLISNIVDYPPGGASVPHRHAPSAFIYAYVLSGAIRSQVNDEPVRVYRAGEMWFEKPGARHPVSANASDTEPARLLAVVIVDDADDQITVPDHP